MPGLCAQRGPVVPIVLLALCGPALPPTQGEELEPGLEVATLGEILQEDVRLGERYGSGGGHAGGRLQPEEELAEEEEPAPPKSIWKGWDASVSLGVNGSSGNSEQLNFRAQFDASRTTDRLETSYEFSYAFGRENGDTTENYMRSRLRNDWLFPGSRWRWFAILQLEFDELQDWRWRVSGQTGPGYQIVKTEKTSLVARAGLGFLRDLAGDESTRLEAVIAADLKHQFNDRNSAFITAEYFPSLDDSPEFRTLVKAGWESLLDEELDLSVRFGFEHRHDSDPGSDSEPNDVDFFVLLTFNL